MIGDAAPHPMNYAHFKFGPIDWRQELKKLCDKKVQIYSLQCGGDPCRGFWDAIASQSGGAKFDFKDKAAAMPAMLKLVCLKNASADLYAAAKKSAPPALAAVVQTMDNVAAHYDGGP
eukprot:TRINITY_DN112604_c0_g1_i1.p2 TRINITY_DN112604_c0_g1~~TRINITY_DN112604_c0_g1_i1.p2  ORF type:complete len:118 (-),score=30.62 TRINITY_DN112604_c0_g1_i1:914-1267(-)